MTGFFRSLSRESGDRVWAELGVLGSVAVMTMRAPVIRLYTTIRFIGSCLDVLFVASMRTRSQIFA